MGERGGAMKQACFPVALEFLIVAFPLNACSCKLICNCMAWHDFAHCAMSCNVVLCCAVLCYGMAWRSASYRVMIRYSMAWYSVEELGVAYHRKVESSSKAWHGITKHSMVSAITCQKPGRRATPRSTRTLAMSRAAAMTSRRRMDWL